MSQSSSGFDNYPERQLRLIPIEDIIIPKGWTRADLGVDFDELVSNIEYLGVLNPISVKKVRIRGETRDRFQLLCGSRRLKACMRLGWKRIPTIVMDSARRSPEA